MSLLSCVDTVCSELGLAAPTAVVGSNVRHIKRIESFIYRASKIARDQVQWPELRTEGSITLVADQANYSLPVGFDSWIFETEWNRTSTWPLIGPISPQEWQARKGGIASDTTRQLYTVKGRSDSQIFIHPTPDSGDAGNLLYFEYMSKQWIMPVVWTEGDSVSISDWRSYNGNVYAAASNGTTGATPPTHTTGTASDGAVSWTYQTLGDTDLQFFEKDTDWMLIDEDFIALGAEWLYNRSRGFPYEDMRRDWFSDLKRIPLKKRGARTLPLVGRRTDRFLSRDNVPETIP